MSMDYELEVFEVNDTEHQESSTTCQKKHLKHTGKKCKHKYIVNELLMEDTEDTNKKSEFLDMPNLTSSTNRGNNTRLKRLKGLFMGIFDHILEWHHRWWPFHHPLAGSTQSHNTSTKSEHPLRSCEYRKGYFSGDNQRRIRANDRAYNSQFRYANNYIKTSKYSVITFLPLNLFEQFQRLANFYFLCLFVLQLIPAISSLTPVTTALPLIGVLGLTVIKDAYDDIQRHVSDSQVNNRRSVLVRNGQLIQEKWSAVQVGDVVRMENNQFIAADVLLLTTSEPNGLCYIETSELDGETNLKARQCLVETAAMGQDNIQLSDFDGEIICEMPNNLLNKFDGKLVWRNKSYSLDNDKIILRGCMLRNTHWCYGVVIFAGKDTKLMQNSGKTKFKRTSIDRLLNFLIIGIVFFLLSMCLFSMVACGIWESLVGQYFQTFLPWDSLVPTDPLGGATIIALLVFFSYAIVLNTVVPISLYVSVEVIRFVQSFLINWDEQMYHEMSNTYAKARTTTLNEELGQVEYIFTDKTGTLTQNIMTFNKCSIMGVSYGDVLDPITGEVLTEISDTTKSIDFSSNPNFEKDFKFYDPSLLAAVNSSNSAVFAFFRLLALCHTVMSEEHDGYLEYQAQSPDEAALVSAARNFGFVFRERSPNTITIEVMGEREVYELLCILDFNNVRKRMSVILKLGERIQLLCKGADNVIYERLSNDGDFDIKQKTTEHLNKFAGEGLRTLCLASRDLDEQFFTNWYRKYQEAALAIDDREEKLHQIYEEIEQDMCLVGVTAIEDKLQDGVAQTISNLIVAGVKIWVLTGDKQETAINIGYSCQLLSDDLVDMFIVDGGHHEEVHQQLVKFKEHIKIVHRFQPRNNTSSILAVSPRTQKKSDDFINSQNRGRSDAGMSTPPRQDLLAPPPPLLPPAISVVTFSSAEMDVYNNSGAAHAAAPETMVPPSQSSDDNNSEFAIVINGHSLTHCLHPQLELLFLEVVMHCKSVICCRVTPLQKALVVELVKRNRQAVTLAIGDGANDVSMIKAAHIGVGISGQEGMQAVLSSDYSIAQFRYLERLLLVHGRWSYYRMCNFLRYFFNKNFAFTLCHFWYAFFCGFSAQTIFDPMYISVYNLFYTSLPVLALGIFDQDVNDKNSISYPQLYKPGHYNLLFNKKEFFRSALLGCYVSAVLFFITFGTYHDAMAPNGHGLSDYMLLCSASAAILVIVNTAQIVMDTNYWTVFNHIMIWGSLAFYFIMDYFYNYVIGGPYGGSLTKAMSGANFWFTSVLVVAVSIMPVLAWRFYFIDVQPTLSDRVRLKQRLEQVKTRQSQVVLRTPSSRRARRSIRSGYAFAHQEGFGRLITSGKIMGKLPNTEFKLSGFMGKLTVANHTNGNNNHNNNNNSSKNSATVVPIAYEPRTNNNSNHNNELRAPIQDLDTINL